MIKSRKFTRRRMMMCGNCSNKFYIFKYGNNDFSNGITISSGENYKTQNGYPFLEGYFQVKGTSAASYILTSEVDFTGYDTLYFECDGIEIGNVANSYGRVGYGTSFRNGTFKSLSTASNSSEVFSFDISSVNEMQCIVIRSTNANGLCVKIKNIWLEKSMDSNSGSVGDSNNNNDISPTDPMYYTVEHNYDESIITCGNKIESLEENCTYYFELTAKDGYVLSSVEITMNGEIIYNTVEERYQIDVVTGNIVITANATAESSNIYIFDSTRTDNFLFGKYQYTMSSGSITSLSSTWPCASDTLGSPGSIVLDSLENSGMFGKTYSNASLTISPNNVSGNWGEDSYSENVLFANNVVYDGHSAGTLGIGIPGKTATLCFNAYKTQEGEDPTITYNDESSVLNEIFVNNTTSTKYSMNINFVSGGKIILSAANNCGNFIITDIWLENYIE